MLMLVSFSLYLTLLSGMFDSYFIDLIQILILRSVTITPVIMHSLYCRSTVQGSTVQYIMYYTIQLILFKSKFTGFARKHVGFLSIIVTKHGLNDNVILTKGMSFICLIF